MYSVGASNKLPINCGSIAKPFGCGKPNDRTVQPRQSNVALRPTFRTSKMHCTKHQTQIMHDETKKTLTSFSLLKSSTKYLVKNTIAKIAKKTNHKMPAVKMPRVGFSDQKIESVAKNGSHENAKNLRSEMPGYCL